jgi:hypothetical protein
MAEELAGLALQLALRGDLRLDRDSQAAVFSLRTHLRRFMSLRYRHYKLRDKGIGFRSFLVMLPGEDLQGFPGLQYLEHPILLGRRPRAFVCPDS